MFAGVAPSSGDRRTLRTSGEEYIVQEERGYFPLLLGNSPKKDISSSFGQ